MNKADKTDRLKEAMKLCEIHHKRMFYAFSKVSNHFPLDARTYEQLTQDDLSYIDQLIFRFSKLQDSMGKRLFPDLLEALGEDVYDKPFIDKLNILERLELLNDHRIWLNLRETRNLVTHEYPFEDLEIIEGLNALAEDVNKISVIWEKMNTYISERFGLGNQL